MLSRTVRSRPWLARQSRSYAIRPDIPVLPPSRPPKNPDEGYAVPPMLPPDLSGSQTSAAKSEPIVNDSKSVPFGSEPVSLSKPPEPKRTHRLRNFLVSSTLLGALLFAGGVYGSLQNDTIYEMFTEFVPYGEESVLYVQEREFRSRYPQAHAHISKATPRANSTNIYIPQSGVMPKIREEPPKHTEAKILQSGPQNSALKPADKATPGSSSDVSKTNKVPSSDQASSAASSKDSLDKTGMLPASASDSKKVDSKAATVSGSDIPSKASQKPTTVSGTSAALVNAAESKAQPSQVEPRKAQVIEPVPPPSAPLKTFDIPQPNHKSIEALQFALNGIIKSANQFGSAPFFRDSIENAKDEILTMNKQIAEVQAQEQLRSEQKLAAQAQEFGRAQQQQIAEINSQLAEYEQQMSNNLAQEKQRINQAYLQRLTEETKRIESITDQKLQNELLEQAIELQKTLAREVKSRVEEERGGRLGKLEGLQKSIAELKQLNIDSSSFIEDRVRLQELEIALNALKSVLHENKPRSFLRELAAVKDIAGSDELLRITIDTLDKDSCESGVPSLGQLGERFRSVAEEVRKAAILPDDAGVAGHATSWLLSKVMFRKRGMVPGTDVEAALARAEAYLEANDLDSATREMNALTGWAHILSSDWLKMARRYLELQQAIELMENSVVLQALKTR